INLFRLLKVDTLDFMSELHKLTSITIDTVSSVKSLPNLDKLENPCDINIVSCKSLDDYNSLKTSTMVEALRIENAPNTSSDEFLPILENQHIRYVSIHCKTVKIHTEVKELIEKFAKKSYLETHRTQSVF
ncbi:MAG: hypothetical protein Q4C98_10490, partial [Capnocytophaga sp.]|nr:hypothetical protein [Capnocytophaga sp.]